MVMLGDKMMGIKLSKYIYVNFRRYRPWKLLQIDIRLGYVWIYINWHYGGRNEKSG